MNCVQFINYKIIVSSSAVHNPMQVVNVRGTSTSEVIYYHSRPCPFGGSAGNRLNINNYEILAACHTPASLDPHRRSVSIRSPELAGRGINALNYNKEKKRRRVEYNRGQRVARCALPISQPLMECDRF